jgi:hypothetical protein
MAQNTSHAVMAQRSEARDSLDHFPTPCWATRALCEWLKRERGPLNGLTAWEPACAEGYMASPLREYFERVTATDVHQYGGLQEDVCDFLMPGTEPAEVTANGCDWIITNPPFRLAQEFIWQSIRTARVGSAFLVRTAFLEGIERFTQVFSRHTPLAALQFSERVPMHKGKVTATGSTATAYCWIVFLKEPQPFTRIDWIGPCRRKLERPGDYDAMVEAAA